MSRSQFQEPRPPDGLLTHGLHLLWLGLQSWGDVISWPGTEREREREGDLDKLAVM